MAGSSAHSRIVPEAPAALPGTREFAYTPRDFDKVRRLIHAHAGIALGECKSELVYSRLARRVRTLGHADFASYIALLEDDAHPEWEFFVNALTTNQTDFFREAHHFPILVAHLANVTDRPARVWSAASSTGEEPYSIAMALAEARGTLQPPVEIQASDLDTGVLAAARKAVYAADKVANLESARLKRFFLKGVGAREGSVRVRREIAQLVTFRQLNLRDAAWDMKGPFDAIFCRNVLIYFDKPTQREVLARLAERLADDGLFFAGHSESLLHVADLFEPCGRTVYRKAGRKRVE
jgi:chemotaxis protein methyltransferase CheR